MKRYKLFFKYFNKNKKAFWKYSFYSLIVGMLELFGVALTYPFILKLLNNDNAHNGVWNSSYSIGICIILLFLMKNFFMIFYIRQQTIFIKNLKNEMNLKFVQYFLSTKYQESSKISLAKKNNIINFLLPNVVDNYILRLLNLNVNFFIFGLISLLLIVKFPLAMLLTSLAAAAMIYIQNYIYMPHLKKLSSRLSEESKNFNQRSNEAILDMKGVKISNNEYYFYNNYQKAIEKFTQTNTNVQFLYLIPPYVTEPCIIIVLFVLIAVITYQNASETNTLIASFAVIVAAVFRLAPTISRIQTNLNGIHSVIPILDEFLEFCKEFDISNLKKLEPAEFYNLQNSIEVRNLNFAYEADKPVLKDISFKINKGEFIGIAGESGSGKTTLIDIISGLYTPDSGDIFVDGIQPQKPLKIGYIAQEYKIIDGSIKDNVIYGNVEQNDEKVIKALKSAQLLDYIKENYPEGINANPFIDSTGFSQGQKQRLAIARALYADPDILILDEATSSLDLKTEAEICNVLNSIKGEKTIIAIAHRLSTIKSADRIIFLKNGTISDIAPFEKLVETNQEFKELAELSNIK